MKFKLFIMGALLCASQAKSAAALDADLSMVGLTSHFSRMSVGGSSAEASASSTETTKSSPKKGIRRTITLDDLKGRCFLRSFATYSIDGNTVKIDPEKELVTINRVRHAKPKTETYTGYVYRILRSKKKSKEMAEKNARRRQALMAKRRVAAIMPGK
tara:strand:+ start:3809 stop:4282 length:474 start_codon:yes stop_codon:yes gene_type:complete